jgi:hypothetical protein
MPDHASQVRALALGLACLGLPTVVLAAGPIPDNLQGLRGAVVELRLEHLKLSARLDVLQQEKRCLERHEAAKGTGAKGDVSTAPADDKVWAVINDRLQEGHKARLEALRKPENQDASPVLRQDEAARELQDAYRTSLKFVDKLDETEKQLGAALDASTPPPLWDADLQRVALWGTVALVIGVLLAAHESRRPLRRRFRASRLVGILSVLALPLIVVGCGARSQPTSAPVADRHAREQRANLEREFKSLNSEAPVLRGKAEELEKDVDAKHRKAVDDFARLLPAARQDQFRRAEDEDHKALRDLLVAARVTEVAANEGADLLKKHQEGKEELARQVEGRQQRAWLRGALLLSVCVLLGMLAVLPLVRARRQLAREQKQEARKCPRCLALDSLAPKENPTPDPRYPEPDFVECGECQHEFRADYLRLPRLCFPTVGIRASGKTHWLVTAYDMVKHNQVRGSAAIKKVPSTADEEFDTLVELYRDQRSARPTTHDLPAPLTYHLADADRWGESQALLNLFDFSGEMTLKSIRDDAVRRRALLMDGFFYFLDPTQLHRGGRGLPGAPASLSIKEQIAALTNFYEEMCNERKQPAGARLDVPVAVCISKIDLLPAHSWELVRELRSTRGQEPSLHILHYRSELCRKRLPMMFPGWNVERTLNERFGKNYLFFPLTPVSLEEGELGKGDLASRTDAPFGIMDPIQWLLHAHGYCMFD